MKLFIFGSTGDLVKRKVLPALQNLDKDDLEIFALGRRDIVHEDYLNHVCEGERCSFEFKKKIKYHKINFEENNICRDDCPMLFDKDNINYIYISLPPNLIEKVLVSISKFKEMGFDMKILIEKPFGNSSVVARNLKGIIEEKNLTGDVFLNDHYLFKEHEFSGDFEKMKIVSVENVGLEGRVGYYDSVGAVRDMIQSHFMNLVFRNIEDFEDEFELFDLVEFKRGQYNGYSDEVGGDSETETFAHLKFKTKTKEFEFITGKAFSEKEIYFEVDGNKFELSSNGDYEKLFGEFFEHDNNNFAKVDHSVFSWELIENLLGEVPELFYYDKDCGLMDV